MVALIANAHKILATFWIKKNERAAAGMPGQSVRHTLHDSTLLPAPSRKKHLNFPLPLKPLLQDDDANQVQLAKQISR